MSNTPNDSMNDSIKQNLGTRRIPKLPAPRFPDATLTIQDIVAPRSPDAVDVLLVNPPSPDGAIWIRSQHRVGRRTRENMIWPQVSLAQMAALLHPRYKVAIIDAIAERMGWKEFEEKVRKVQPKYYLTQVTAPTLTNDMYGCFLAKSIGAKTMAMGTHVTPMARQTLEPYPALDFVLRGEPEMTLVELVDALEGNLPEDKHLKIHQEDITWQPIPPDLPYHEKLARIRGLVWRRGDEIVMNLDRPFFKNLDDMPVPMHHLLPLDKYRIPMIKGPYTFIVTSRGCTAGCKYCIKHVS